jgi:dTDP-4-amino-4,6-dideoxygalactose transaminase
MLSYGRQTIDEADIAAVVEALRAPQLTCGPLVARFETALGSYLGAEHVSVCSSGTSALHLAYAALGIGEGDEIITTPVRIADVDPRTGNLSIQSVEALITSRTRAIVAVHLAGLPADMAELTQLARRRRILIIEDACHALGATYRGVKVGAGTSDAVVFSFHPVKHITTGEGGAVVVRDARVKQRIERLRQHGIERDPARMDAPPDGRWVYEVQELGWNYRLSDLSCALGIAQLAKLDQFLAARRALAAQYRVEIAATFGDAIALQPELADRESAYHLFTVAIDFARHGKPRDAVMGALAALGVGTQVHYVPLLQHPLHAGRNPEERARPRPGTDHYYARTLSLPLYPSLTPADVTHVVDALFRVLGESR